MVSSFQNLQMSKGCPSIMPFTTVDLLDLFPVIDFWLCTHHFHSAELLRFLFGFLHTFQQALTVIMWCTAIHCSLHSHLLVFINYSLLLHSRIRVCCGLHFFYKLPIFHFKCTSTSCLITKSRSSVWGCNTRFSFSTLTGKSSWWWQQVATTQQWCWMCHAIWVN